jgi:hypothetical protein
MKGLIQQIIVGAATAVIAALVTSPLAVWFSLRRFYSEKWWERKMAAYTAILESLHHMSDIYNEDFENERRQTIMPDPLREREQIQRFRAHREELNKYIDIGTFLLSEAAVSELSQLSDKLSKNHETYLDDVVYTRDAIDNCLIRFREIARRDLSRSRVFR